jgi:hypothetical protein
LLLALSSLIAIGIGTSILVAPAWFHASHGIELGSDANLLSEVRAPGGALLALGLLMLTGVFVRSFTFASTSTAAAVFLAYGLSRLLSIALDGVPGTGLVVATVVELAVGGACAVALGRSAQLGGLAVLRAARAGRRPGAGHDSAQVLFP